MQTTVYRFARASPEASVIDQDVVDGRRTIVF
jgi:hypothetical protein